MSAPATLAVTGSTGALGGLVARGLADRGLAMRLLARTPSRAPQFAGSTVFEASYSDSSAVRAALTGADVVFMVSAAEAADRRSEHFAFIDAAAAAGVGHIVYTSFFRASPTSTFTLGRDHAATEEHIAASGMSYTFLRDNFYLDFLAHLAGEDGVIRGPAADGRVAAVARADVARCAISVLADPASHRNATYSLTGPEALSMVEIAEIVTAARGRDISYHNETVDEAYESRRAWEAPQWQYDAWVSTYTAIAAGELDGVTHDVATLTGQQPIGLRDLLAAEA